MTIRFSARALLSALGGALVAVVLQATPAAAQDFCWKDSYGRGVGTVPSACAPGQDRIGLLCYDQCGPNMQRFGFDCHSVCPAGMRDDGLFCRRAEYGRGGGYPWKFGDPLNDSGMIRRCEADHGRGNCEKNGLIYYPKCQPGFTAFGCCICRPAVPDCVALGMNPGIDLSCAKKIQVGNPQVGVCGSGEQRDAGLCYPTCKAGFNGVGPVCWSAPPPGWVECGMGAAKDSKTCASTIFGQVASVGQLAVFIASFGTSSAGSAGASGAQSAGKLAQLKAQFAQLQAKWETIKNIPEVTKAIQFAETANKIRKGYNAGQTMAQAVTEEDIARAAAQIAAILDPSGVSSTVAAYTYPKCSKYFPQ